ncbi:MAG: histidine phosphatase family protein [Verrucomicrobiota bacterium]
MKTTLYLIRHGQTEWNAQGRMQGRMDSPLTDKGVRMAERLAMDFPKAGTVYSSPIGRAMQTARIIFGDREVRADNRLREINLGDWEGRLQADLDIEDAEEHSNFWKAPHLCQPPAGENFQHVEARSVECLRELAARHEGESIAIVSHTTVIRSMLFAVEPRPLSAFWSPPAIYPASLSEIDVVDGRFNIARFGDITHYDPQDQPTGAY